MRAWAWSAAAAFFYMLGGNVGTRRHGLYCRCAIRAEIAERP